MRPDDGRVVPTFVTQALRDEDITVYGDGEQTRSFCYVDDLIRGLRALMDASTPEYSVYNLGKENEQTILELAETVLDSIETASEIVHKPLPEDDPARRKPDIKRAETDLQWNPEVPLSEGLDETVEYFEEVLSTVDSNVSS
jgi:UDP-glucuronate decarboxylase